MEKIYSAKLLDDAKEQAYREFEAQGADRDEVEFTILEQPVRKLFGTKGEFKIKAEWNPVEIDVKSVFAGSEETEEAEQEEPTEPKQEPKTVTNEKTEENKKTDEAEKTLEPAVSGNDPESANIKVQRAVEYLTEVLKKLGIENFTISTVKKGETVVLNIEGEDLGVVIGRRGETLDALQYLTILAGNRGEENYCKLSIDCCGYREKRKEALEALAVKTARKVIKAGRRITLEPMNPYERRIIHSKIAEIDGVNSRSTGDEPFRKVVISAIDPRRTPRKNGGNNRNGNYSTDSYRRSSGFSTSFEREYKRRDSSPSEKGDSDYSEETVELEKSVSLYGKIEL